MKNESLCWTDELVVEFVRSSQMGPYGMYSGLHKLEEKLEKFKELKNLNNMDKEFNGHIQEGWPKTVPTSSMPKYVYIRVKKGIERECWYKDMGGRVFKALNKLHFGFADHTPCFVTQVRSIAGTHGHGINVADVEVLKRGEPIENKTDTPELTLEDLRKIVGPFKLKVE